MQNKSSQSDKKLKLKKAPPKTKPEIGQGNRKRSLSRRQAMAAELHFEGHTQVQIAEALGVTRQTVNEWVNNLPAFQQRVRELSERSDAEYFRLLSASKARALRALLKVAETGPASAAVEASKFILGMLFGGESSILNEKDRLMLRAVDRAGKESTP